MAVVASPEAMQRLTEVRRKSFRDQAIWFLNAAIDAADDPAKCDLVQKMDEKCSQMIDAKDSVGSVFDEFTAHRLLEFANKPTTSPELRRFFSSSISSESGPRSISLAELLCFQFGYDFMQLAKQPECRDLLAERNARDELQKANDELSTLTEAAKSAARAAEEAHQSEEKALRQELAASKAAEDAVCAKIALENAQEKSQMALEALKTQEEATQRKMEELESIACDSSKGIVSRNRAKAELSIMRSEDPITLRAAKVKQEASIRRRSIAAKRAEDTVALSETALVHATHARKEALRLKESALAAAKQAENAIPNAQSAFDRISQTLEEMTRKEAAGKGTVFFIQADLNHSRKYLPQSRFVVAQKQASELVELALE